MESVKFFYAAVKAKTEPYDNCTIDKQRKNVL